MLLKQEHDSNPITVTAKNYFCVKASQSGISLFSSKSQELGDRRVEYRRGLDQKEILAGKLTNSFEKVPTVSQIGVSMGSHYFMIWFSSSCIAAADKWMGS